MAIRQYIGARYVPRFTGVYDPTQIYDALDVVDNGSGTSYIARKTVPAGTSLTDTTYWFVYGASSGAILALQNRMDAAEQDILDLNADIDLLKYGEIILVSDSYGYSPYIPDAWEGKLNALIPNTCYYCNGGGHGFGSTPSIADDFIAFDSSVPDPSKVGLIIAMLGYNDRTHLSDIPAGINNFVDHAALRYPNAKVLIGYIAFSNTASINTSLRAGVLRAYRKYASGKAGCGFIEGSQYFMLDHVHMQADGIHPSADGGTDIAHGIYNYLKTHTAGFFGSDVTRQQTLQSSGPHDTAYTDKILTATINGDMMSIITSGNVSLTYSSAVTPLAWVEFGTLANDGLLLGDQKELCSINTGGMIYTDSDPHWEGCGIVIGFEDGKAYYRVLGSLNYTRVLIPSVAFSVPLIHC